MGERVDRALHRRLGKKDVDELHEREKRVWVYNLRNVELGNGLLRDERSRSRALEHLTVSEIGKKRNVGRTSVCKRREPTELDGAVSYELSVELGRKLVDT